MKKQLYTIGHSTHSIDHFVELLLSHSVDTVCDVRSNPHSKFNPQFNRDPFKAILGERKIRYVFLGDQLGARSKNPSHYVNGKVQYKEIAGSLEFKQGLDRIRKGIEGYSIALMCAEKDPVFCHRAILVCRYLRDSSIDIQHIRADGSLESHDEMEKRMIRLVNVPEQDLFMTNEELVEWAYDLQGDHIAYSTKTNRIEDTEDE